jgi:carbon-monoxide dehydrogenase large subunit
MEKAVGKPIRRREDARFITGAGRYLDDLAFPGACHAYVLRSPLPHADILGIDRRAALGMPGVIAILTGEDAKTDNIPPLPCCIRIPLKPGTEQAFPDHPVLAQGRVRYVGEPVAFIIAETLDQARDAAECIVLQLEPLPFVTDPGLAQHPRSPRIHDASSGNLNFTWEAGSATETEEAFARAHKIVSLDLINNRVAPSPLETRGAIGQWDDDGGYTLHLSCQGAHWIKDTLCKYILTDVPEENVRVVVSDVGGGFGTKLFLTPEYVLVLWAARRTGRTIRWIADRSEGFLSDTHGRDNRTHAELALGADGRFLGLRVLTTANMGAYLSEYAPTIPTGDRMHEGTYVFDAVHVEVRGVFTNTGPVESYRGAGRPEATYMIERLVDLAGRETGLGPVEIRRRNFIRVEQIPYRSRLGHVYDSGDFPRLLDQALVDLEVSGFDARRSQSADAGRLRGFGISSYIGVCAGEPVIQARLAFQADDTVLVTLGTQSSGQGHETAYAQIVADTFGIDMERIVIRQGDTQWMRSGSVTAGSRSIPLGGVAAKIAAMQAIRTGALYATDLLGVPEADIIYADGLYRAAVSNRSIGLFDVAAQIRGAGGLLEGHGEFVPEFGTFTNGCHICEVEIDPATGQVTIDRYVAVDDFGTVINPMLVAGQVHGGVAQGIGQALLEEVTFNLDGTLATRNFEDYAMPVASHLPYIQTRTIEIPCVNNPLGTKGVGEAGAIAAPPAVVNAILDATWALGIRSLDMPVTSSKLWMALDAVGKNHD